MFASCGQESGKMFKAPTAKIQLLHFDQLMKENCLFCRNKTFTVQSHFWILLIIATNKQASKIPNFSDFHTQVTMNKTIDRRSCDDHKTFTTFMGSRQNFICAVTQQCLFIYTTRESKVFLYEIFRPHSICCLL